jgi:hypothetical protein
MVYLDCGKEERLRWEWEAHDDTKSEEWNGSRFRNICSTDVILSTALWMGTIIEHCVSMHRNYARLN